MEKPAKNTVQHTLSRSNASAEFYCDLNEHFGFAIWTNEKDHVKYNRVGHHTLSLYLEGGYSTCRLDQRSAGTGAPDKFCILPAGHDSDWEVGERQRFIHFYFSESSIKNLALQDFDIDPRRVELPDRTYFQDKLLSNRYHHLISQGHSLPEQKLALQEGMWEILGHLLTGYSVKPITKNIYRGGLTKRTLEKITEYIQSNIEQPVTLEELAKVAEMSPFHFTRMFKASTGRTPHQQVISLRIAKAAQLLLENRSQLDISIACGFANQSHFSRLFRKYYGVTPKQFIRAKGITRRSS